MREIWELPIVIRSNATTQSSSVLMIDPEKISGIFKHPITGWACLLMPQSTTSMETCVAYETLREAWKAKKITFERAEPAVLDPRDAPPRPIQKLDEKLNTSHQTHHHS